MVRPLSTFDNRNLDVIKSFVKAQTGPDAAKLLIAGESGAICKNRVRKPHTECCECLREMELSAFSKAQRKEDEPVSIVVSR